MMLSVKTTIAVVGFLAALFPAMAQAEMPLFAAQCPQGNTIDADRAGTVRVNGVPASLRKFNEQYYEAESGGITYSISHEGGGRGLLISYNPPGSSGGVCTIVSSAPPPSGGTGSASSGMLPEEDFFVVRLSNPGGWLNIRNAPRASAQAIGRLPDGVVLRNAGGCTISDGQQWCNVEPSAGGVRGWVSARFLALPGPGGAENPATADDGGGAMAGSGTATQRVRFDRGMGGTEFTDSLMPQQSRRYVLNARNGQEFYFRLAANGPGMVYRILNPDGSALLDEMPAAQEYRGQLWQSGDHVVVVTNRANGAQSFNLIFGVQ